MILLHNILKHTPAANPKLASKTFRWKTDFIVIKMIHCFNYIAQNINSFETS